MQFCPQCRNILDIGKQHDDINYKIIESPNELIKYKDASSGDISRLLANFSKQLLLEHTKFNKLSEEQQNKLLSIFSDSNLNEIVLKCENCSYLKNISNTILIYKKSNSSNNINTILTEEECQFITNDPLLPYTTNYICPNIKCDTHENTKLKKAVSYKQQSNYIRYYICTKCYTNFSL